MAKRLRNVISFTPGGSGSGSVVISGYVDRRTLLLITNTTYLNTVIYNFADQTKRATAISYNSTANTTTVTLFADTTAMTSSDALQIFVEESTVLIEPTEILYDPVNKFRTSTPQALIDTDFEVSTQYSKWESIGLVNNRPFAYPFPVNLVGISQTISAPFIGIGTITMPAGSRRVTIQSAAVPLPSNGTPLFIQDAVIPNVNGNFILEAGGSVPGSPSFIGTFTARTKNLTGIITCAAVTKTGIFSGFTFTGSKIGFGTTTANLSNVWGTAGFSTSGPSAASSVAGFAVTVTTAVPHGLVIGNEIGVTSVFTQANFTLATGSQGGTLGAEFPNGAYQVATVGTSTIFTYYTNQSPVGLATTAYNTAAVYVRPQAQFLHRPTDGGVIFSSNGYSNYEHAIRQTRRYFRYQSGKGIQMSSGTVLKPFFFIDSLTSSGTTVTVQTKEQHNITRVIPGTTITISGANESAYNGTFTVDTVTGPNSFTYQALTPPSATTASGDFGLSINGWYGAICRLGLFDTQNGIYFEFDGQTMYVCRRQSTFQCAGRVTVNTESNTVTQSSTAYPTLFSKQLKVGGNVVIRGAAYKVMSIQSDTQFTINPSYRGPSDTNVLVSRTDDLRIPQSSWNLDKADGTGASGYNLDLTKMQMFYLDFSWYGAGFIRWGFRGNGGNVFYVHKLANNNVNNLAYMRSGNLPARYEIINHPPTTFITTSFYNTDNYIGIGSTAGYPTSGTVVVRGGSTGITDTYEYINYTGIGTTALTGLTRGQTGIVTALNLLMPANVNVGVGTTAGLQVGMRVYPYGLAGAATSSFASGTFITNIGIGSISFSTPCLEANPTVIVPPMGATSAQNFPYSATSPTVVELAYPTYAPTLSHWGTSVIMDGRFDDDKSLVFTYGQTNSTTIASGTTRALLSIRIAPSVDNGLTGLFGARELTNRMQLVLRQLDMSLVGVTTGSVLVRGYLNAIPSTATYWTNAVGNVQGVPNSSLAQIADYAYSGSNSTTITNGEVLAGFYVGAGAQSIDLSLVRDLGNSIVGGGSSFANANYFPDGPDTLTITATNLSPSVVNVASRLSWTEAQA